MNAARRRLSWRAQIAWAALLALGVCAAVDGWRLFDTQRTNRAIADGSIVAQEDARAPQALFAQAYYLAARGDDDRALNLYKRLQDEGGELAQAARYNAGNIHLRQALALKAARGDAALGAMITPTELAKQAYRDVLRASSSDWDARFNLERALRLLPDQDDDTEGGTPRHSERAATTMRNVTLGLP
ncbi:MAG TPA: MxaK protein [Burkholderiaceae bacterium]|nr:MxaK protein [Burkholderiaceae bacterium]